MCLVRVTLQVFFHTFHGFTAFVVYANCQIMIAFHCHDHIFWVMGTIFLASATAISNWRVDLIPIDFFSTPPHSSLAAQLWPPVSEFELDPAGSRSFTVTMYVGSGVTDVDLVIMNGSAAVE